MISVITPVYNASEYIDKNIRSVLSQHEVGEHVLVDDGSSDDSWELILKWKSLDSRVIAVRHADNKNHGRSRSRNLGIKTAKGKYIAFLDADDYFLPNRFNKDIYILENDISIDGVYNAIGAHYYSEKMQKNLNKAFDITTVSESISPEKLFFHLHPFGDKGYFSGNGLTVRNTIFDKVGYFNESLEVGEDSNLWKKMALICKLMPGELIKPVAIRGVHEENSFHNTNLYSDYKLKVYIDLIDWMKGHNATDLAFLKVYKQALMESRAALCVTDTSWIKQLIRHGWNVLKVLVKKPSMLTDKRALKATLVSFREIRTWVKL